MATCVFPTPVGPNRAITSVRGTARSIVHAMVREGSGPEYRATMRAGAIE